MTREETIDKLQALVRAKTADRAARVHSLGDLPGHAGHSYSFVVERSDGAAPPCKMVVRIAAPGVKIAGPADIERQARILQSMREGGSTIPVPPVHWHGAEPEFFDRPYMVVGYVSGFKLHEADLPEHDVKRLARKAIEMLAALHELAWETRVGAFGPPFPLQEEMRRLDYMLDRPTLDPAMTVGAAELRARLAASLPADPRIGCVHGDFQWANILYDTSGPVALIDWEISLIGPVLLDVGWTSFFADRDSFVGGFHVVPPLLSPAEVAEVYGAAATFAVREDEIRWFRAFSGYRFGVITCFNTMLHRRGKREDPMWESVAPSAARMFERALELLG
jgi:aminoglycoside phosphotransferase (APT) family kinase protein